MSDISLKELTKKLNAVLERYRENFPDVVVDRDYFPFKVTEEWGECLQAYLMLTKRGRQKGKNESEIQQDFEKEFADVFGFLMLFADREGIDIEKALNDKWFKQLEKEL